LYEKGKDLKETTPMFKIIFICNVLPKLKFADEASWNRTLVIPFESTFSDKYPPTYEEQLQQKIFPIDHEFKNRIPNMAEAFMWYILNHRSKNLDKHRPPIPLKVKAATEMYKKKNDIYHQFIYESIKKEEKGVLFINQLYTSFKNWYRNSHSCPGNMVPTKDDVVEHFTKRWGQPTDNSWPGYTLKEVSENALDKSVEAEHKDVKVT
jgi:phage/plasmid-associated DNA primase